jgi:YHS domain-containing protein
MQIAMVLSLGSNPSTLEPRRGGQIKNRKRASPSGKILWQGAGPQWLSNRSVDHADATNIGLMRYKHKFPRGNLMVTSNNSGKIHIDPICGMEVVEEDAAAVSEYNGKAYYFCCEGCKEAFDENPQQYA